MAVATRLDTSGGSARVILAVVAVCAALAFVPTAGAALEYRRSALASAPWRLATSQLVHWSAAMAAGDLLLLAIAGWIVERRSRRLAVTALAAGAAATAVAVALQVGLTRYRGSSGLGTAMLVAGALLLARDRSRGARGTALAALAVLAVKIALEIAPAGTRAPTNLPEGIHAIPAVHLASALAGALAAWSTRERTNSGGSGGPARR